MMLAVAVFAAGIACLGAVLGMRWLDAKHWAKNLVAYRLRLPANLKPDDVSRWLEIIAGITQPPKWSLLSYPPIAVEVEATRAGITHYVIVPKSLKGKLLSLMRSGLPGARLEEAPDYLHKRKPSTVAAELKVTNNSRPLLDGRAEIASNALLAGFQPLSGKQAVRYQVIMTAAGTPAPVHSASPKGSDAFWATYLVEGEAPADADAVRAARRKQETPLLNVSIRLGVTANSRKDALALFSRSWGAVHTLNAPGVRLVRCWLPSNVVRDRLQSWTLPITRWPMLLNSRELPGLLAFRFGGISLPGVEAGVSRQIAPSPSIPQRGSALAVSNYPGMTKRPLAISTTDRMRHVWYLAPIGGGKSTAMENLALQDARDGHGFVFIDPKADAIENLLARLPEERADDVIVFDPASTERPVGFNLLSGLHDEHQRELVVDNVVHIMASLWRESWGPRSHDLLRNSLLTLVNTRAPDGSVFTLAEIPELLTNQTFRRFVTNQPTVPAIVRPFWAAYEQKGASGQADISAPLLNKLRQFLTRTSLRLMLGQSEGIDLGKIFNSGGILLAKLSKGTIGTETAQLIGALLIAKMWQEALKRAAVPPELRRPFFWYLDEFQDILRQSGDLADTLVQARALNVGLVLANQHPAQLPEAVRTAVLSNVQNQVVFRLKSHQDATMLANYLSPLTAEDLKGLDAYEAAVSLSVNGSQHTVTGRTLPLPEPTFDVEERAAYSRERFGQPRADVEAALEARIKPRPAAPGTAGEFGRKTRGGTA
ncbi:type IV secretory system conjugative DNA transfer family protein [Streptomyces sp. NPDC048489]|uniref:type IV secretory system conjugative DNA transfer family protein n=1 Tax=Streptomyces sp. NPDC048489 TaxID=3154504 RepID=UPI003446B2EF